MNSVNTERFGRKRGRKKQTPDTAGKRKQLRLSPEGLYQHKPRKNGNGEIIPGKAMRSEDG